MRIHFIGCRVLTREVSHYAATSPHALELDWLPQGLHNTPDLLRQRVQQTMDQVYADYEAEVIRHLPDAFCLGYGLCANGVVGLTSREKPIIVPRTDDCIALFLGSQARYLSMFNEDSGVFWLNHGWIDSCYDSPDYWAEKERKLYEEYCEQYGEDNAEYLMENETLWKKNYHACVYIDSDVHSDETHRCTARAFAEQNSWAFREVPGDNRMLRMLTHGDWPENEFLLCPPHHRIEADYDGGKLKAVPLAPKA